MFYRSKIVSNQNVTYAVAWVLLLAAIFIPLSADADGHISKAVLPETFRIDFVSISSGDNGAYGLQAALPTFRQEVSLNSAATKIETVSNAQAGSFVQISTSGRFVGKAVISISPVWAEISQAAMHQVTGEIMVVELPDERGEYLVRLHDASSFKILATTTLTVD